MRILLTGARGFIGSALAPVLLNDGHEVLAATRHPDAYDGPGQAVEVDVGDAGQLADALQGCDAAYYLVHAMEGSSSEDFRERDRRNAEVFAAAAGPERRVIYLGALEPEGDASTVSEHLRSRIEVGEILRAGTDGVELRAAVVIGAGGASYEMLKGLAERLPIIFAPEWAETRTHPIALPDVVRYLVAALEMPPGAYDIGGPDVLTYTEMVERYAEVVGLDRRTIEVPFAPEKLSAAGVAVLTGQPLGLVKPLIEGLRVPVVAETDRIRGLVPGALTSYEDAIREARAAA